MKRLNVFLESLLDKSGKVDIVAAKEIITSVIADRINNKKVDLGDRMGEVLDALKSVYKPYTQNKFRVDRKPTCLIIVRGGTHGVYTLFFEWIQSTEPRTYWEVEWALDSKLHINDFLVPSLRKGTNYSFVDSGIVGCYEIPEEDMREYFRTINDIKPYPSFYDEDKQEIIRQVTK